MQRSWWIIGLIILVWAIVVSYQPVFVNTRITPKDEEAIQQDWLLYDNTSGYENDSVADFRWLIVQPKEATRILNRNIEQSLTRASVLVAYGMGEPSWWKLSMHLSRTQKIPLVLNGVMNSLTWEIMPQKRMYHVLVPYTTIPQQSHTLPLKNAQYLQFGFTSPIQESDNIDTRRRIAMWYGSELTLLPNQWVYRLWWLLMLVMPCGIAYWAMYQFRHKHPVIVWFSVLSAIGGVWVWEMIQGVTLSLLPLISAIIAICVWYFMKWVNPHLYKQWSASAMCIWYVYAIMMDGMHAYAVSHWMQGVDFATLPTWADFWQYLLQMRMAIPIPMLAIEYILYRSEVPGLFTVIYLTLICRLLMLLGVVFALFGAVRTRSNMGYAVVIAGFLIAGIAFVSRYYDRNAWMVYDACFAVTVLVFWHFIRHLPTTYWGWLGMGFLLVWLDSMRPFMIILTPILACIMVWLLARRYGRYAALMSVVPLSISLVWHLYHGLVLGQWTWSSFSGFNIARAWNPILAIEGLAKPLTDMNSVVYMHASADVLHLTVEWMISHPFDALMRAWTLGITMLSIPVEMMRLGRSGNFVVIVRDIPWYVWGYRLSMILGLVMQLLIISVVICNKRYWLLTRRLNAVFVLIVIGLICVSEFGEQARFLVSVAPLILYDAPVFGRLLNVIARRKWVRTVT